MYVGTTAKFNADGVMIPTRVIWEDSHEYIIDKVTDIRQATAIRARGQGNRYTIRVNGTRVICSLNAARS